MADCGRLLPLLAVTRNGAWEPWPRYMLRALEETARAQPGGQSSLDDPLHGALRGSRP
jgi:hypothetical protein